jgi:hypothetical protein
LLKAVKLKTLASDIGYGFGPIVPVGLITPQAVNEYATVTLAILSAVTVIGLQAIRAYLLLKASYEESKEKENERIKNDDENTS